MTDDPAQELAIIEQLQAAGDYSAAETKCNDLLSRHPEDANAQYLAGLLRLEQGRPNEAIDHLRLAVTSAPQNSVWCFNLALAMHQSGNAAEAVAHYRAACQLQPEWMEATCNLGVALLESDQIDEAISLLRKTRESDPSSVHALSILATAYQQKGDYDEAIGLYRHGIELAPNRMELQFNLGNAFAAIDDWPNAETSYAEATRLAPDSPEAWFNLGQALHHQGRLDTAVDAYARATEVHPDYLEAQTNLGVALRELGREKDALDAFEAALTANPTDAALQRHVRSMRLATIPHWHFRMIADEGRNGAYRDAIEQAVNTGDHVLDIGTGSGLLAMMAVQAGAAQVTACEISETLAETARAVIEANQLSDRIEVVNRKSTALRVGEEIPQRADVIVSEIVDVGLLGEGMLPTMRHALRHLAHDSTRVIPASAVVFAQLAEIPVDRLVNPVRLISGFDLSEFDRFRSLETYIDFHIERVAHRILSEPVEIARFNFVDPTSWPMGLARVATRSIADGTVHAVVVWFDLHLDDQTCVTTRPGESTAWGQAIYFLPDDIPVRSGDELALNVQVEDSEIQILVAAR